MTNPVTLVLNVRYNHADARPRLLGVQEVASSPLRRGFGGPFNMDKEGLAHPATSSEQRESSEIRIALRADVMGGGSMGPWLLGCNVDLGCGPIGYVRHEDGGRLGIYHHALKNEAVFRRMAEKAQVLHAAGGSGKPGVVIEVDPDVPFRYVSSAMEALKAKGLLDVRVVARATDAIGRPLCIKASLAGTPPGGAGA